MSISLRTSCKNRSLAAFVIASHSSFISESIFDRFWVQKPLQKPLQNHPFERWNSQGARVQVQNQAARFRSLFKAASDPFFKPKNRSKGFPIDKNRYEMTLEAPIYRFLSIRRALCKVDFRPLSSPILNIHVKSWFRIGICGTNPPSTMFVSMTRVFWF